MNPFARFIGPAAARRTLRAWMLAAFGLAAALPAPAVTPQSLMKDGREAYEAGRAEEALKKFQEAAKTAEPAKLDPAPAEFNQGTTLLKLGRGTEADPFLEKALRTPDLRLQSRTWYNRANELTRRSSALAAEQKLQEAQAPLESAIASYENAITLDPADPDAKVNYELAVRALEELKKQIEQQKQQQQQQQDQKDQKDQQKKQDQQDKKDDQTSQQPQQQDQPKPDQDRQNQDEKKDDTQKQDSTGADQQPSQDAKAGGKDKEEMSPEEARMLLDAMKDEEEAGRERLRLRLGQPEPVDKNW